LPVVELRTVTPVVLAAVRREIPASEVGSAWKPALDKVWEFLQGQPGLWAGGHNIFVYRPGSGDSLLCDFGVEVMRPFESLGDVRPDETPGGEVAVAVHRGAYARLREAYDAIDEWMSSHGRQSAGVTWEIYGDPTPDPRDTETTVIRLLVPDAAR
jgi:hypothetical protein